MLVAAAFSVSAQFMNGGAGTGAVDFFHGFQVALMMTLMFNLVQFVWWRCKASRRGTCLQVHGPTLWTLLAAILVQVQPLWILIIGSWHLCCGTNTMMGFPNADFPDGSSTGYTYPPWSDGAPRECAAPGGNVFWTSDYCDGSILSTFPNKGSGWAVQVLCTWGGFVFMFVGVLQATKLHVKLKKQWTGIRTGQVVH